MKHCKYKSIIIADDFTGANDTAAQFSKFGFSSITILKFESLKRLLKKYDVIAIDTESRSLDPETSYEILFKIGRSIKEISISNNVLIYKKIDSTLRGNIIEEIKGLYDALNPDVIIFAPAYPKQGRITINGIHMVNGIPINQTIFGKDLRTPVKSSNIPSIFMQIFDNNYKHILLEELRSNELSKIINNYKVLSFDIENDNDIKILVEKLFKIKNKRKIIWVGSAGLAEYIAYNIIKRKIRPFLIVIGSPNEITKNQVRKFLNELGGYLILINIKNLIENFNNELKRVVSEISKAFNSLLDIIITTSYDEKQFNDSKEIASKMNISIKDIGNVIAEKFGELISSIINKFGLKSFKGIFISGGDTSIAIVKQLGINSIRVKGEVEAGIPILNYKKFIIVTKAGGFGTEDTLIRVISKLKSEAYEK
ncbi:MAG: four-carbon acid sugar kinase family protein [Nitrososphaerota archaeon]